MKELSIFVDESGDFGKYAKHSPYYIVSIVAHDQSNPIENEVAALEEQLSYLNYPNHCIHTGPIIRMEYEYLFEDIKVRRKLLFRMMAFIRRTNIKFKCFYIEKRHISDQVEASVKLSTQLKNWVNNNYEYLLSFDVVKIYYDNGQSELSQILSSIFTVLLPSVEPKRVRPSDYRLFQVADFVCTMKLLELKMGTHSLSKSELFFFGGEDSLKKEFLDKLKKFSFD